MFSQKIIFLKEDGHHLGLKNVPALPQPPQLGLKTNPPPIQEKPQKTNKKPPPAKEELLKTTVRNSNLFGNQKLFIQVFKTLTVIASFEKTVFHFKATDFDLPQFNGALFIHLRLNTEAMEGHSTLSEWKGHINLKFSENRTE